MKLTKHGEERICERTMNYAPAANIAERAWVNGKEKTGNKYKDEMIERKKAGREGTIVKAFSDSLFVFTTGGICITALKFCPKYIQQNAMRRVKRNVKTPKTSYDMYEDCE